MVPEEVRMTGPFKPLVSKGRTVHVHGTAAQVEFTNDGDTTRLVAYRGWGTVVQALDQTVWVHVPFPVDVDWSAGALTGGRQEGLGRLVEIGASWEFQFEGDASYVLGDVHLWDGASQFAHRDKNTRPKGFDSSASKMHWALGHTVQQSLGMSLGLRFGSNVDGTVLGVVTLFSAFAVFE